MKNRKFKKRFYFYHKLQNLHTKTAMPVMETSSLALLSSFPPRQYCFHWYRYLSGRNQTKLMIISEEEAGMHLIPLHFPIPHQHPWPRSRHKSPRCHPQPCHPSTYSFCPTLSLPLLMCLNQCAYLFPRYDVHRRWELGQIEWPPICFLGSN